MDELADRIAGAAAEVLGAPPIRRLVALQAPGAAAIAAELPRRGLEPGQGRKAPFAGIGGRALQDHARVAGLRALAQAAGRASVHPRFAPERAFGDRQTHARNPRDASRVVTATYRAQRG